MLEKLNPFAAPLAVTEITDLRIYPIKSCRGISVRKSHLTKRGLDLDRRWMFVDAETMKCAFLPPSPSHFHRQTHMLAQIRHYPRHLPNDTNRHRIRINPRHYLFRVLPLLCPRRTRCRTPLNFYPGHRSKCPCPRETDTSMARSKHGFTICEYLGIRHRWLCIPRRNK